MRTIIVVFTDRKVSLNEVSSYNWNVGHYGCTAPTINNKNEYEKYSTIQEFYKHYDSFIVELFKIADSIDFDCF